MKKKVCILGICLSIFLVACGNIDNEIADRDETSNTTDVSEVQSEETEETITYFESDEMVNDFFASYNEVTESPIDIGEIKKGNIRTKALVYIADFSMEVINATDFLSVSISVDPENEDTKLLSIFSSCIKAMNSNVTDDEISSVWNAIHETGYMVENYDFNGIKITYVPSKELSWGTSALRIDLKFPIE